MDEFDRQIDAAVVKQAADVLDEDLYSEEGTIPKILRVLRIIILIDQVI